MFLLAFAVLLEHTGIQIKDNDNQYTMAMDNVFQDGSSSFLIIMLTIASVSYSVFLQCLTEPQHSDSLVGLSLLLMKTKDVLGLWKHLLIYANRTKDSAYRWSLPWTVVIILCFDVQTWVKQGLGMSGSQSIKF